MVAYKASLIAVLFFEVEDLTCLVLSFVIFFVVSIFSVGFLTFSTFSTGSSTFITSSLSVVCFCTIGFSKKKNCIKK
jgi:hypothetical protein